MKIQADTPRYRIPAEIYILLHRWGRNLDGMPNLWYHNTFGEYRPKGFREEKSKFDEALFDRICHRIDVFLNDSERDMLLQAFRYKWKVSKCMRVMGLHTQGEYYERFDRITKRLVELVDNPDLDGVDVLRRKREKELTPI